MDSGVRDREISYFSKTNSDLTHFNKHTNITVYVETKQQETSVSSDWLHSVMSLLAICHFPAKPPEFPVCVSRPESLINV